MSSRRSSFRMRGQKSSLPPRDELPAAERKKLDGELLRFFNVLSAAIHKQDAAGVTACWDTERLFDELAAQIVLPENVTRQRADFARKLRVALGKKIAGPDNLLVWDNTEIRHVRRLKQGELVVITRHSNREGGTLKMRWWLVRQPAGWQVYDLEDLDMGPRYSANIATILIPALEGNARPVLALNKLGQAQVAFLKQQNVAAAEQALKETEGVALPGKLEATRHYLAALVHLHRNRSQAALDALNRARAINPDMPVVDLLRAVAFNNLAQWDRALTSLDDYQALLGDDADVCRERGNALSGLGRVAEARVAFRKSLDYFPKDGVVFLSYIRMLGPNDSRADIGLRFRKLDNPRANFDVCADDCVQAKDNPTLEQLALAMRTLDPKYAPAHYHLAMVRAWANQPGDAVQSFRTALALEKDAGRRGRWATEFFQAAAQAGAGVEAYQLAPDPVVAFRLLAAGLKRSFRAPELWRLLDAHAKKHPNDPLLPLYKAEVLSQQGKHRLADKAFQAALVKPPAPDVLDTFRFSRVSARFYAGHLLDAYAGIGPRAETFRQLADLCLQTENFGQLQLLLDVHAARSPTTCWQSTTAAVC